MLGHFPLGGAPLGGSADTIGPVSTSVAITEGDDTISAVAVLEVTATLAVGEANDVASAAGTVDIVASVSVAETDDTSTSTATLGLIATAAITEGDDVPSAAGTIDIVGSLSAIEDGDTVTSIATVEIIAVAGITEGGDRIEASALMPIFYPSRGSVDDRQEYERRQREWEEGLRRIIDRAFAIAAGEIDPITGELIPPPDYSPVIEAMLDQALSLDQQRVEAFMVEDRQMREDDAIAMLLLA